VWEGVVSYLTPEAVDQNFRMLARIVAPRNRRNILARAASRC
jgi:O-methyltransferase involved in polyketide biosynthesis